ncbi:sigma-70 family RNA polymerase sigma factor [Sinomonas sp. ASV486]|uniref:RNA polymerase sigma factor n=1 Tax=Sinomonas sp. ASV486 TaxID=3051170 RepID=UPI0027DC6206|nr:sigma-70 family RNA polymerase sigma factor [Sinomonas sp. ASV486]MDQ4489889.1 sigma-70 family RNA polymerase sigma factor [Sinomonas sp. ASV486]
MPTRAEVAAAVAEAHRAEWGFVLASTLRFAASIDEAEDAVQDAYVRALAAWESTGIPARPGAWLTTTARRRLLDARRRDATAARHLPELVGQDDPGPEPADPSDGPWGSDSPADDRLRLIFTCCHPALAPEARAALTLRLLCGLTTAEIARCFLVSEPTMAARITRAKKKIAQARIPYRVPGIDELPERLETVLDVVHMIFTVGHTAPAGEDLVRADLMERAHETARLLHRLLPEEPGPAGLLALIVLTDARRAARLGADGAFIPLEDQDRALWDRRAMREGTALAKEALRRRPLSRFALMAAIAAVHDEGSSWEATDWREIVGLYDVLLGLWPSPVVALNRAVAVGFADGPAAGLAAMARLEFEPQLARYGYLAAARADFLRRIGRLDEARIAYEEALVLTDNEVERAYLERRLGGG